MKYAPFVLLFLMACKGPQKSINWQETNSFRIKMERTACFGTCPIYSFSFSDKPYMDYNGIRFVEVLGEARSEVTPTDVAAIKKRLEQIDWEQLAENYPCTESDLPSVILTIQTKNFKKKIEVACNGPQNLNELILWLDDLHKFYMPAQVEAPPMPEEAQE